MRTLLVVIACALTARTMTAQSPPGRVEIDTGLVRPVGQGAAVMGIIGAVGLGLAGAWFSQGICDAADCSGAWREGIGPGAALGAFLGGAVGVLGGLAQPLRPRNSNRPVPRVRVRASPGIGFVSNQGHERTLLGLTAGVEVPAGPLSADLQVEHFSGGDGWSGTGITAALSASAWWSRVRVRWLAGLGGFAWSNPGYVVLPDPQFPGALVQGHVTDAYVVPLLGFGVSYTAHPSTSVHAEMRFHHHLGEGDFLLNRMWAPFTVGVSHRL